MPQATELLAWPPCYVVKKHAKARHVKLKASLQYGLEIVVPLRFNQKYIPDILEKNKSWIEKKLKELSELLQNNDIEALPNEISLQAKNQVWKIRYIKTSSQKILLMKRPLLQELVLMGDIENKLLCKKILSKWIVNQAKQYLSSQLKIISDAIQLSYANVTIRAQRTRWGSCSSNKSISLNYKLIFFPEYLANHVIIHELCHTVHLNHSVKFWRLVASFDKEWKQHNSELRHAEKHMPIWLRASI